MNSDFLKKHTRLFFLGMFLFLLFSFYIVSTAVKKDKFHTINFDTTVRLQDKIGERVGGYLEDLTFFVNPSSSAVFMVLLSAIAVIDVKKKRLRLKGLIIPLAFLLLVGAEIYGKGRVESPAPPFFMIKNPTTVFPKYHVVDQYSYPSGHASRALFMAGVCVVLFWQSIKKRFGIAGLFTFTGLALLSVILISIGKIYLGEHWFSDIIGGWVIGGAFLSLVFSFFLPI